MLSDSRWKRAAFMTAVVVASLAILGIAGFFLWFIFPVQKTRGLTYLEPAHLITYYSMINFLDVIWIVLLARLLYFRRVKTADPVKDGLLLGAYMVIFSWLADIVVYIFIRGTLPSVQEYFLGKNQPEIGIAWLVALLTCVLAGWLESRRRALPPRQYWVMTVGMSSALILLSIGFTAIGILIFDIRP
jgi:hypothetical protein